MEVLQLSVVWVDVVAGLRDPTWLDGGELKNFHDARTKEWIMTSLNEVEVDATNPSNTTSEAVLRQLTAIMKINNETNKDMNGLRKSEFNRLREKDESKKNRLKKLQKSAKNMILNSSATQVMIYNDLELIAPYEPVESCMDFFSCETTGLAENELYNQFKELVMPEVDFAHRTVQAIIAGQFQYNVGVSPSNLSAFCFCKKIPVQKDEPNRSLIFHLVATQGRFNTMDEINLSTK